VPAQSSARGPCIYRAGCAWEIFPRAVGPDAWPKHTPSAAAHARFGPCGVMQPGPPPSGSQRRRLQRHSRARVACPAHASSAFPFKYGVDVLCRNVCSGLFMSAASLEHRISH
jgi:hypothetical protein